MTLKTLALTAFLLISYGVKSQAPAWSWAKKIESYYSAYTNGIAIDNNSNLILSGIFFGDSLHLDTSSFYIPGLKPRMFLFSLDSSANTNNARIFEMHNDLVPLGITTDSKNNIIVVGTFNGNQTHFGGSNLKHYGMSDGFVAKFNSDCNILWSQSIGGILGDSAQHVEVDKDDNIIVGGFYKSIKLVLASDTLVNSTPNKSEGFVAKFNANGNPLWLRGIEGKQEEEIGGLAVDKDGNIGIVGHFNSQVLKLENQTFSNKGQYDVFYAKYSPNGNLVWAGSVGDSLYELSGDIGIQSNGDFVVSGSFDSEKISIGKNVLKQNPLAGIEAGDIMIWKIDKDGNARWSKAYGGRRFDVPLKIDIDKSDNIYVAGRFNSFSLEFDNYIIPNTGGSYTSQDAFITKFGKDGTVKWAKGILDTAVSSPSSDILISSLVIDKNGSLYTSANSGSYVVQMDSLWLTPKKGSWFSFFAKLNSEYVIDNIEEMYGNTQSFKVYPNPVSDQLVVSSSKNVKSIRIYNSMGSLLFKQNFDPTNEVKLDLSGYPIGIYHLSIENSFGERHYSKILKKD